jgi:hypothetical protein
MNTPCWEAGGGTALVGGNPTEQIGSSRVSDMEGKMTRVGVSKPVSPHFFSRAVQVCFIWTFFQSSSPLFH